MAGGYAVGSEPIEWLGLSTAEWVLIEPFWPAGFMRQTDYRMAGAVVGQQYEIRSPRPECGIEALSRIAIQKARAAGAVDKVEMQYAMQRFFRTLIEMPPEEFKAELVAHHLSSPLT